MDALATCTTGTIEKRLTKGVLAQLEKKYGRQSGWVGLARAMLAAKDDLVFDLGIQLDHRRRKTAERRLAKALERAACRTASLPTRSRPSRSWLTPPAGATAALMRARLADARMPSSDATGLLSITRLWLRVLLVRVYQQGLLAEEAGAVYIDFTAVVLTPLLGMHGEVLTSVGKKDWHPALFAELLLLLCTSLHEFPRLQLLGLQGVCATSVEGADERALYSTHVLAALKRVLNVRNPPNRDGRNRKIVGINLGELWLDARTSSEVAELLAKYNVPRYFLDSRYIGGDLKKGKLRTVQRAGRAEWWEDVGAWPDISNLQKSKCAVGYRVPVPRT